jgi:hypothetical protein
MPRVPANQPRDESGKFTSPATPDAPEIDAQGTPAVGGETPDFDAIAQQLGLDPASMSDDDRTFVQFFEDGARAVDPTTALTLEQLQQQGPTDSLIPPAAPDDTTPAATDPTISADGSVSGTTPDAQPGAGGNDAPAPGTSAATSASAPLSPTPEGIASPFPNIPIPTATPADADLVDLGNGVTVPREYALRMLEAQMQAQQHPMPQGPQAPPTYPQQPQQGFPQPGTPAAPPQFDPQQFLDPELAAYAHQQQQQLTALSQQHRQLLEGLAERQQRETGNAMLIGVQDFQQARDITDEERNYLIDIASQNGTYRGFIEGIYAGDPRSAASAAMEATFWTIPALRDREIAKIVQQQAEGAVETERKKALHGGIQSTGTTPHTAPAIQAGDRDAALQGMAAEIERSRAQ